jgi:hypothetical protein
MFHASMSCAMRVSRIAIQRVADDTVRFVRRGTNLSLSPRRVGRHPTWRTHRLLGLVSNRTRPSATSTACTLPGREEATCSHPAAEWPSCRLSCFLSATRRPHSPEDSEAPAPTSADTAVRSAGSLRLLLPASFDTTSQSQFPRRPIVHHCCNTKGAIIAGAIGATIGLWFATLCDAGSCTSTYVKYALVLGGIGVTVGAFAHRRNTVPIAPPDRRFSLGAVVTPRTRAAFATLGF